jgi:transglutaminase-like putative cysteine protease
MNSFITPSDVAVQDTANYIVSTLVNDTIEDRIVGAFNWVALNVVYISDRKQFGKNEFWQYPNETLGGVIRDSSNSLMYGDCEDSSFLLASLLLAMGVPSNCVRVGLSDVHAWVEVNLAGVWYLFETTDDTEMMALITANSVVGKIGSYKVRVYVYQGGCKYVYA